MILTPTTPLFDGDAVKAAVSLIAGDAVTELRALEATSNGDRYPATYSGYFNDPNALVEALAALRTAKGIYITPNPVTPALLARAQNRLRKAPRGESTSDGDIVGRRWLLIDADPVRPAGISSTEVEHEAALARCRDIASELERFGWPAPILADSGNGGHLLYRINLPADDGGIVVRCLAALARRFDDAMIKVDTKVGNSARIWKLYGTLTCKGDSTSDRPHRVSKLLKVPGEIQAVPADMLEALATSVALPMLVPAHHAQSKEHGFDLEQFIADHLPYAIGPEPWAGKGGEGQRWTLNQCPWNCDHTNGSAYVIRHASGAISAGCHHNSCAGRTWADLRALFEPPPVKAGTAGASLAQSMACGPVLQCMADVKPTEIDWLWPGRIPLGRITLLVGRPGEGKSYVTIDMAARISTGTPWPDGSPCPFGSVILVSAEDDPGDTIRPRLDAHNADARKVHLLKAVRRKGKNGQPLEVMFTLADVAALEAALKAHPDCKLVVIDPIGSFLGGDTDAHRDNEVRSVLAPVARLAAKYAVAVVMVAHRRKSAGTVADDLALGSRAFTGIARAVWHLTRDPISKARRLLLPGKNNLAHEGSGLAFSIAGDPAVVAWEHDPVAMNADEALAQENGNARDGSKPGPVPEALTQAMEWLAGELSDLQEHPVKRLRDDAEAAGLAWRTVQKASRDLGVKMHRASFGGGCVWRWPKPAPSAPAICANSPQNGELGANGANEDLQRETDKSGRSECHTRRNNSLGATGSDQDEDLRREMTASALGNVRDLSEMDAPGIQHDGEADRLRSQPREAAAADLATRIEAQKAEGLSVVETRKTADRVREAAVTWPMHWREQWEERAGIMEHEGKLSGELAEICALHELVAAVLAAQGIDHTSGQQDEGDPIENGLITLESHSCIG